MQPKLQQLDLFGGPAQELGGAKEKKKAKAKVVPEPVSLLETPAPDTSVSIPEPVVTEAIFEVPFVTESAIPLSFDLPENDGPHNLRFVMTGKTTSNTKINELGEIIQDATITISNVAFEEIELNQIVIDNAVYTHNFNGSQPETQAKFYGVMGCNGTVSLEYETPVYLWLLEKM
jgi:hypothetical protein